MIHTIASIADLLGLHFQGDANRKLTRVSGWDTADESALVFLEKSGQKSNLPPSLQIGCLMAHESLISPGMNAIFTDRPKLDFARAAEFLLPRPRGTGVRHASACIAPEAEIGINVDIGPNVVIGAGARIGSGSILQSGVIVGEGCRIGENSILYPRVVLYPGVVIAERVTLHAGVIVGCDGFGYMFDGTRQVKFPQVGGVIIENDVEIGANTTIDRGSLGATRIGAGTKLDNLIQVAHNVQIGKGVVIAAQTGISGSTVIEDFAVIGGQVGFGDHTRVQKGAIIGSKAGILPGKIVRSGDVYWGVPVRPLAEYKRLNALFGRLPEMKADIDRLKLALKEFLKK
jgi:UDP-3-O-[3-hydroxymyristoyl] glucosamine N-acyltransferase